MRTCLGCDAVLTKRWRQIYCSNKCQRTHERRTNTARWLLTGEASVSSNPLHYVRIYLLADQQSRCAICASAAGWQGKPLVLVLDHIDGDSTNNRRDNLRLVCPNCESQLPTFKNRNQGKGGTRGVSDTRPGCPTDSAQVHQQGRQTAEHEPVAVVPVQLGRVDREPDTGEAGDQRPEGDDRLEPSEARAEAVVDAVPEGQVVG